MLYAPENCFEFYLADTRRTDGGRMASIDAFGCMVADYAARQRWEVDPFFGGPYEPGAQLQASSNMSQLSRFGGNFYGCEEAADGTERRWDGAWRLQSQWHTQGQGSYISTLVVHVASGGVSVEHGGHAVSNVRLGGGTLSYRINAGHHTADVTLVRSGDRLTGSFAGWINATREPMRGTYTGRRDGT